MKTDATTSPLHCRKRPNKRPGGGGGVLFLVGGRGGGGGGGGGGVYLILGVRAGAFNR